MMARNYARLAVATGKPEWLEGAQKLLKLFAGQVKQAPTSAPLVCEAAWVLWKKYPPETAPSATPTPRKTSAEMVTATAKNTEQGWEVELNVSQGWHIYANPAGGMIDLGSQTVAELWVDGKRVECQVTYPKAESHTDRTGAKYDIYKGTVTIKLQHPKKPSETIEIRVNVVACQEGTCLAPATLKPTVKP
jgi:uncharacterized protein YyaL (SSP411 family)